MTTRRVRIVQCPVPVDEPEHDFALVPPSQQAVRCEVCFALLKSLNQRFCGVPIVVEVDLRFAIGGVAAICSLFIIFKPDPDPNWPVSGTWINMAIAVLVLAIYAVLLTPLGFILPTAIAAGILSYQISPRKGPAILSGIGLSLGMFVLFKYALDLGNIVAYRVPTPGKLWEAITILIPFVGH